jgi:serine/threonine protein kinase/sugar lactone lactonase YvrE
MGEVYRARDPRLQREVAIKVLPSAFASDRDRLKRFEQEARAAGSLNHPNLLAVFDIGTQDGSPYLVTELLEGATLRECLRGGALALRKALDYAAQVADGLAAAHERGIVHRDLKPENIFVCRDGRVKILDFGLAKLTSSESSPADFSETHSLLTGQGSVLGTPGYMAPEQVRGQAADARADIFSFGAVLYEMLTGERAFKGETTADVASAILRADPNPQALSSHQVPPALERIVHHCLEKSPEARFHSARDLAFHLRGVSVTSETAVSMGKRRTPWSWVWAVPAILLVAVLAATWQRWSVTPGGPADHTVDFRRLTDFDGLEEDPAISPDGKAVAFSADVTGSRQIWVRLLTGGPPLQITHDPGDHVEPRWSQDSSSLYYYVPAMQGQDQGTLWEVAALGGAPRRITSSLSAADVSHQGNKLAFFRLNEKRTELVVSESDGTNAQVLSELDVGFGCEHPRWSPDDRTIAYQHASGFWNMDLFSVSASGGTPRRITHIAELMNGFTWLPDSAGLVVSSSLGTTLLYLPTMHLWRVPREGGEPHRITYGDVSYEMPDIGKDGRLYVSARHMRFDIRKFPVDGAPAANVSHALRITRQTAQVLTPSLSPDDREMAYLSDSGGQGNVWVMNLATGETRQITAEKAGITVGIPLWSPDGTSIIFAASRVAESRFDVDYWTVNPDGSNQRDILPHGSWASWSPDGRWIYYSYTSLAESGTETYQISKMSVAGGPATVVRQEEATGVALSPDSSTMYFVKPLRGDNGTQNYLICAAHPEGGPERTLASFPGTRVPVWQGLHPSVSPDGRWLALPLNDNSGTNIWLVSTADGRMRQVTDFGDIRTYIARRVTWTSDGHYLFAAVGQGDADIVQLGGLLR